jgi:dimeric dUTPase (all-alpha-NTP-PPase superfamily)
MKHIPELLALQNLLDDKIRQEKGITGDTSQKKVIAFKVEFGEFLNEHKGFKFWKKNPQPRTEVLIECESCGGSGRDYSGYCGSCHGGYVGSRNPMLEEYVDGIHFILSIGLERKYSKFIHALFEMPKDVPSSIHDLSEDIFNNPINSAGKWLKLLEDYLMMGYKLGFTDKQVRDAYVEKNKVNHVRQATGY